LPWGFVFREEEALLQDISGSRLRILLWHFSGAAVVGHVLASRKTGREQKEEEAICASFFFFWDLQGWRRIIIWGLSLEWLSFEAQAADGLMRFSERYCF
jgi:hypothetical protein